MPAPFRPSPPPSRDLVVPCAGEAHRVRLTGGRRLFASARCPRCQAPVDPLRWRRLARRAATLVRPVSTHPADRILHAAAWAWLVAVVGATLLLWGFADVWWPATVLLFGPRWVLLLPVALLLPWAALRDRAFVVPLVAGLLVGVGPLVGMRTGWRGLLPAGDGPTLRVATFNARGGDGLPSARGLVQEWNADVAVVQECGGELRRQVRALAETPTELSAHVNGGMCLLSRLEVVGTGAMEREVFELASGSGLVHGYRLRWGTDTVTVTNVHLETQRAGLNLLLQGRLGEAIPRLREKSFIRAAEHRAARRWADSVGTPGIVAGDFNTPPESRTYRAAWQGWTNAFTQRGSGVGGTRLNGWIRPRIDHVLVDGAWRVVDARVGRDVGSDHLPVIATLRLR